MTPFFDFIRPLIVAGCVAIASLPNWAKAESPSPDSVAEYVYLVGARAKTLQEFAVDLPLSKELSAQAVAYLAGHGSAKSPMPMLAWTDGSPELGIGMKSKLTLDFSALSSQGLVALNGAPVAMLNKSDFSGAVAAFQKAMRKPSKAAWLEIALPSAAAQFSYQQDESFAAAMAAFFGLRQSKACGSPAANGDAGCVATSEAEKIERTLGKQSQIRAFQCSGSRFERLRWTEPDGQTGFVSLRYPPQGGEPTEASFQKPAGSRCAFPMANGRIGDVSAAVASDPGCQGHAVGDGLFTDRRALRKGDQLATFGDTLLRVSHLQKCCNQNLCKEKLKMLAGEAPGDGRSQRADAVP